MTLLTYAQQDALFAVHKGIFGTEISRSLATSVRGYNSDTLELTEDILNKLRKCNGSVQKLLMAVAGGSMLVTKGWLRSVLEKLADEMSKDSYSMNGAGCRNRTASVWIAEIHMSVSGIRLKESTP